MTLSSLIAIPSPRDIPATTEQISQIKGVAKLWVKYWPEDLAYDIIKQFYLNHTDAEYLVITPDDLMVSEHAYNELVKTIEKYGKENMPVFSGVCNVHNIPGYITQMAICVDRHIAPERRLRNYQWADFRDKRFRASVQGKDRIQVKFAGFPFMFIRRDIVEKIGLEADLNYNPMHRVREGYSIDVVFCHNCLNNNIPIYVNPWLQMLHLRGSTNAEYPGIEPIKVYKERPKVLLTYENDKQQDITSSFSAHMTQYNKKVEHRKSSHIVPNLAFPGRVMTNDEYLDAAALKQDARSAGSNKIREQRRRTEAISQDVSS